MFLKLENLKLNLRHATRIQIYDLKDGTGSLIIKMVDAQHPMVVIRKAPLEELVKLDNMITTGIDNGEAIMGVNFSYTPAPPDIQHSEESEQDRQFRELGVKAKGKQ